MGSWKIARGVASNRVRRARSRRIPAPQAAKNARKVQGGRFRSPGGSYATVDRATIWTTACISIRVDDLIRIDARADELNMSRSAYLVQMALQEISALK